MIYYAVVPINASTLRVQVTDNIDCLDCETIWLRKRPALDPTLNAYEICNSVNWIRATQFTTIEFDYDEDLQPKGATNG